MANHLLHQELLAYLDGELSKRQMAKAAKHLQSCWSCRVELRRLENDLVTLLDAQNEVLSSLPQPACPWSAFDVLLARSLPGKPSRLRISLAAQFIPYLRFAGLACALICLIVLLVFSYSIFRSDPVSAKEVLRQVGVADATRTSFARDQVLRQEIHVHRRTRDGEVQRDEVEVWKSDAATYWNTSDKNSAAAGLEAEYALNKVPMDLPLSAIALADWARVLGSSPMVSWQGDDLSLTIIAADSTTTNSIERASWIIQPRTWQLEEMTLDFSDASFEVTESGLSRLPVSIVPVNLLVHLGLPIPQTLPRTIASHPAKPVLHSALSPIHLQGWNPDTAELDVLTTLHRLHADLGEPVTVSRSNNSILVDVWELPEPRQREISVAMQDQPGVRVETQAPMDLMIPTGKYAQHLINPTLRIAADSTGGDQRLIKFLGGNEKEEAYAREALATSTAILSHLYTIHNLAQRFPAEREDRLSPTARAQLMILVDDHAAEATKEFAALKTQLEPLDTAFNIDPTELPAGLTPSDWQSESVDALNAAKTVDHWLRCLLATGETPVSADQALPQIQQILPRLTARLVGLNTSH